MHVLGQLRPQMSLGPNRKGGNPLLGMVAVAIALPPPTITELRLEHDTFITRMSPDFTLTYCEPMYVSHSNLLWLATWLAGCLADWLGLFEG